MISWHSVQILCPTPIILKKNCLLCNLICQDLSSAHCLNYKTHGEKNQKKKNPQYKKMQMLNEIIILEVLFQASKIPSLYTQKSLDPLSLVTKPPMISLHERNLRNPQRWRKAPNMGTMGPRSISHISVLEACLVCGAGQTHCTQGVKDVSLMRTGARSSGFPERAGLTCPQHGLGLAAVGRESTHTAGSTVDT